MNWGSLEKGIVKLLKPLTRADGKQYAELCDQYNGEFQTPWSLPEDFNPGKRYTFVQFQQATGSNAGKGSQFDLTVAGQITLLVGSHSASRAISKADVYDMLEVFRKALHAATADYEPDIRVKLLWAEDALEFSEPNHICFRQTYNIQISLYRIYNDGQLN
jgi:hypothetical protein